MYSCLNIWCSVDINYTYYTMIRKEFNRMDKFIDKDHDYALPAVKLKLVSHEATCKIHLGEIKTVAKVSFSI